MLLESDGEKRIYESKYPEEREFTAENAFLGVTLGSFSVGDRKKFETAREAEWTKRKKCGAQVTLPGIEKKKRKDATFL